MSSAPARPDGIDTPVSVRAVATLLVTLGLTAILVLSMCGAEPPRAPGKAMPDKPIAPPSLVHVTREPRAQGTAPAPLLLLLHGVGSNERDLVSLAPHLDPRFFVVSARAPSKIAPDGFAWFPFTVLPDGGRLVDPAEAERSRVRLLEFLRELEAAYPRIDPKRVYVVGFSQGAMMAASLMLTAPERLAGAVMMSGRILPEVLAARASDAALAKFPVLVVHGTSDDVLGIEHGRASRAALSKLPVDLSYAEFPMRHEVSRESLDEVSTWLTRRLDGPPR